MNGAVSYTGRIPWDAGNTSYVPAVTLFDAGLRFQRRSGVVDTSWRLAVSNLAGTDYWTTRAGILYLGAPRVFSASGTIRF